MMAVDVEHATRIIDALASTDYQAQYDRQSVQKKGVFELNSTDAILAQNKIITQQMEALTQQMAKLPQQLQAQQLQAVQASQAVNYQAPILKCDFCGGNHVNGNCSQQTVVGTTTEEVQYMGNSGRQNGQQGNFPNNASQGWRNPPNQPCGWKQDTGNSGRQPMYQQQQPTLYERTSKLEETLEKFVQTSLTNQKNQEASLRNLETQVGQLAKQLAEQQSGQFSANTQPNPKEQCKAITIRCGKQVGSDVNKKTVENNQTEVTDVKDVEEDDTPTESIIAENSEKARMQEDQKSNTNQWGRKIQKGVPLKHVPYPHAPSRKEAERQFIRFTEILKNLQINIPFTEALQQMPIYARFMKELLTKKRKFPEEERVELEAGCSAIIQKAIPQKSSDPGSFTLPITVGNLYVGKALLDLGASINLIPLSMLKRIGEVDVRPTRMTLQLADRSIKYPYGVVEDLIIKVDKFLFPVDFVVMDIEEDVEVPLILGRPFMKTAKAIIDVDKGKLKVCVGNEDVSFNVFEAMKHPNDKKDCCRLDVLDEEYSRVQQGLSSSDTLLQVITRPAEELTELGDTEALALAAELDQAKEVQQKTEKKEELVKGNSIPVEVPELKVLPPHLKYSFLGGDVKKPIILSSLLTPEEEGSLMEVLQLNQGAIGWQLSDLKGISPAYCMHRIHMEADFKPVAQPQRRLNPVMKEVVKKEVQKLLESGMIYPISDSAWVSPVHMVPKKSGMTVIHNEKNELIPTRTVTSWRMCIDYRKLNQATRKDHFPLPFMDQMLERLAGKAYYCFLDGYSGYNQITMDPQD